MLTSQPQRNKLEIKVEIKVANLLQKSTTISRILQEAIQLKGLRMLVQKEKADLGIKKGHGNPIRFLIEL
jgi:hypothetical protein